MADFDSSLPVRTENAGDVVAKIADATIPSQQRKVESDGSINVNADLQAGASVQVTDGTDTLAINNDGSLNAVVVATDLDIRDLTHATDSVRVGDGTDFLAVNNDGSINAVVSATDLDIRDLTHATDSVKVGDGTDFLAVNADGSINSVVSATDLDIRDLSNATDSVTAHQGGSWTVTATATDLDIRDLTHVSDSVKVGDGTDFLAVNADGSINSVVSATDLDIRDLDAAQDSIAAHLFDEAGVAFSASNPLPVAISADVIGTEINSYNTAASIAGGASSNHDYTVSGGTTLLLKQIEASASGKMKIEVQIETGVATNVFNTRFVQFNSTANTNMSIHLDAPISVAAGVRVRVIRTNRDNQSQDVYSTISGIEV
jgi:acylphosphatase